MEIYKTKGENTGKVYYTIIGKDTELNLYGKKGNFIYHLLTNGNGKRFSLHIANKDHIEEGFFDNWGKITEDRLPKVLRVNLENFKSYI